MSILIIIGPSGSGKSELEKGLLKNFYDKFSKFISFTTRSPRVGEVDGKDYYFVDDSFLNDDSVIESNEFKGHFYGRSIKNLIKDKVNTVIIESNGLKTIVDYCITRRIDYSIIYLDINNDDRKNNLINRDNNLNRMHDNISYRYNELYKNDIIYAPDIIIYKLLPLDKLCSIVNSICNIDLPQGPRKPD